jgi:hypothetical protein
LFGIVVVSDTFKEINALNNFQFFIEKLYSLYHQSPKNSNKLRMCAASLEQNLIKIKKYLPCYELPYMT